MPEPERRQRRRRFKSSTPSPQHHGQLHPLYLGGTLVADIDQTTGVAKYLYGLGLCSTLFRIDLSTGNQELLGQPCQYQQLNRGRINLFTGLALQKYNIPTQDEPEVRVIVAETIDQER